MRNYSSNKPLQAFLQWLQPNNLARFLHLITFVMTHYCIVNKSCVIYSVGVCTCIVFHIGLVYSVVFDIVHSFVPDCSHRLIMLLVINTCEFSLVFQFRIHSTLCIPSCYNIKITKKKSTASALHIFILIINSISTYFSTHS